MAKIDLMTVVYSRELPLLKLQARSIAKYFFPESVGTIFVVCNGTDQNAEQETIETEIRAEYGQLSDRLQVLRSDELFSSSDFEKRGGWLTQQVCKLLISRRVATPYYLVLDAKNIFVRNVSSDSFFRDGLPTMT